LNVQQQEDILKHTFSLLTEFNHGIKPKGSVAPWWEVSAEGTNLLLEAGIEYGEPNHSFHFHVLAVKQCTDHSNMAHEFVNHFLHQRASWNMMLKLSGILLTRPRPLDQYRL